MLILILAEGKYVVLRETFKRILCAGLLSLGIVLGTMIQPEVRLQCNKVHKQKALWEPTHWKRLQQGGSPQEQEMLTRQRGRGPGGQHSR